MVTRRIDWGVVPPHGSVQTVNGGPAMMDKLKCTALFKYGEQLFWRYTKDDLPGMSAQITYYLILGFFPFLLFIINLISFTVLSNDMITAAITGLLPTETGALVNDVLVDTVQSRSTGLLILGMLGGLWASSKGISAIIKGLNKAYGVEESRSFLRLILIAITATLGVSMMIIFSFVMIIFGRFIGNAAFAFFGATALFEILWSVLRYCIPLIGMLLTFSLLYAYTPNRKLKLRAVRIGTIFATFGWITTSLLFSLYVNNFADYSRVYGSLGGFIALIVWLYISTLIILAGGELNAIQSAFMNHDEGK